MMQIAIVVKTATDKPVAAMLIDERTAQRDLAQLAKEYPSPLFWIIPPMVNAAIYETEQVSA